jgi:hypothetical protein
MYYTKAKRARSNFIGLRLSAMIGALSVFQIIYDANEKNL